MAPASLLNNSEKPSETKNLSIEIEPSYPLIMAITEFFRAQKKPQQSLELCRRGLNYFPGDLGLRLGLARSYLDLAEEDKAWAEIKSVVQELTKLAPIVESIAKFFRENEQNKISEWFHQLFQVLSTSPEEGPGHSAGSPVPSLFPEEEDPGEVDLKRVEILVVLLIVLLSGAYLGGLFRF